MTRVRTLLITVLPSMVAGGFLFASAFGHAETGRDDGLEIWPTDPDPEAGVRVAQADPWARTRPGASPVPPAPPTPPAPPAPPARLPGAYGRDHGRGISVSIRDGKVEIDGIADLVESQLKNVGSMLDGMSDLPPDVRERIKRRVDAVRQRVDRRLGRLKGMDLDRIGPEMERMGDEIEREMEGLDRELEQLGDRLGKHFARRFGEDLARSLAPSQLDDSGDADDADDDALALPGSDPDVDAPSLGPEIANLKGLSLDPAQREALAKLRADSDRQVEQARRTLDEMSDRLQEALGDDDASEAEIARQIDRISEQEAIIRKTRILTWVTARKVLRKDQRERVESAVKKGR